MAEQKEILESIRDIVSGKAVAEDHADDEILELNQVVNPDGSVTELKKTPAPAASQKPESDILKDIDSLLRETPTDDKDVELEFAPKPEKFEIAEEFAPEDAIAPRADTHKEQPITKDNSNMPNDLDNIISGESATAAQTSISELTKHLKKEGKEANKVEPSAPFRSGATVEDLVVEMLKPMMKDWLDKNLPKLVNEIVQKEIQKLIPRD